MKRKRIYIAYTGGTIGMKKSSRSHIPAEGFLTQTVTNKAEFNREEIHLFHIHEKFPPNDTYPNTH